jgi:probable HAF family extracellular repeat protein
MEVTYAHCALSAALLAAGVAQAATPADTQDGERRYHVVTLESLGGLSSGGNSINDVGVVAGYSNLPGDTTRHAMLWVYGLPFDLGTLGGPNSSVAWPVKNNRGIIAGIAETDEIDPNDEAWSCANFFPEETIYQCRGFVWRWGRMHALPTLGGTHGFATGANNHGRVVGWAENTVHDDECVPPQVLQFEAVTWDPPYREARALPPLEGDSVGAATAINDGGQVVGISGICDNAVGRFSAIHAVRWDDGVPTLLGDIGGVAWNTPMAINERGDIVGFANVPGNPDPGAFNAHAFRWTREGGIEDLGVLGGDDVYSQALGINERGQIVGLSCTAGFASCRAFLWEDGVMMELNDLVRDAYPDHLYYANDIDDFGRITGQSVLAGTEESRAVVLLPVRGDGGDGAAVPEEAVDARVEVQPVPALSQDVRRKLLQQLGLGGATLAR